MKFIHHVAVSLRHSIWLAVSREYQQTNKPMCPAIYTHIFSSYVRACVTLSVRGYGSGWQRYTRWYNGRHPYGWRLDSTGNNADGSPSLAIHPCRNPLLPHPAYTEWMLPWYSRVCHDRTTGLHIYIYLFSWYGALTQPPPRTRPTRCCLTNQDSSLLQAPINQDLNLLDTKFRVAKLISAPYKKVVALSESVHMS